MPLKKKLSSVNDLPSTSFLEEMQESMSGILQEIFESQHEILSFSEDHPILTSQSKNPRSQIENNHVVMQKDLKALQSLCQTFLQKTDTPPSQDLSNHKLLPLQKHVQKSMEKPTDPKLEFEICEMQKWIHVALKQVEKSLDLMIHLPPK